MIDAALFLNQPSPRAWADSWQRRRGGQRATARRRYRVDSTTGSWIGGVDAGCDPLQPDRKSRQRSAHVTAAACCERRVRC
jgi:hypothetical protein